MNDKFNHFQTSALLAADFAKVSVDAHYVAKEEQESKEFKEKHFMSTFPYLEIEDGKQRIYHSNAINSYLAHLSGNKQLFGASPMQESQVDQWVALSNTLYNHGSRVSE